MTPYDILSVIQGYFASLSDLILLFGLALKRPLKITLGIFFVIKKNHHINQNTATPYPVIIPNLENVDFSIDPGAKIL